MLHKRPVKFVRQGVSLAHDLSVTVENTMIDVTRQGISLAHDLNANLETTIIDVTRQ